MLLLLCVSLLEEDLLQEDNGHTRTTHTLSYVIMIAEDQHLSGTKDLIEEVGVPRAGWFIGSADQRMAGTLLRTSQCFRGQFQCSEANKWHIRFEEERCDLRD